LVVPTAIEAQIAARGYTYSELMVAAAAREIADGELVFVGMRLPMLAFLVAKRIHAPNAVGLYENGLIRETPSPQLLYTMGDPPNLRGATQAGQMLDVMALLQQGRVHVGFLGAAEVDRFGNLNSTWGGRHGETHRLPGSGGACDIASLAKRTVVLLAHEKSRLRERVGYITSPGYGRGNGWRAAQGLPGHTGPSALITTLGVLRYGSDGEAFLASTLRVADNHVETPAPSDAELAVMRSLDPNHFWTK
jgi:glutaconate CoA-transferase subunit B